ncbi:hypothetical protein [Azospirillum argentinense]|uniref:hypothetical protein n=1 Tax=Azospirillum argentinense TaxID=2970906 RepID=UPI001B3BB261|nr:hypothetical protein [Azospirillum argentinense]
MGQTAMAMISLSAASSICAERDMTSLIRLCLAKRLPLRHEAPERFADWRNHDRGP